ERSGWLGYALANRSWTLLDGGSRSGFQGDRGCTVSIAHRRIVDATVARLLLNEFLIIELRAHPGKVVDDAIRSIVVQVQIRAQTRTLIVGHSALRLRGGHGECQVNQRQQSDRPSCEARRAPAAAI